MVEINKGNTGVDKESTSSTESSMDFYDPNYKPAPRPPKQYKETNYIIEHCNGYKFLTENQYTVDDTKELKCNFCNNKRKIIIRIVPFDAYGCCPEHVCISCLESLIEKAKDHLRNQGL